MSQTSKSNKNSKKSKANGFLMFLLEYRRRQADGGNKMDMMQSQKEAGEIWETMNPEDRMKYNQSKSQSKSFPESDFQKVKSQEKRYTTYGVSFDEIDRQALEQKQQNMEMELTIEEMLSTALENNALDLTTFFFLSTTAFVEILGGDIYPCELAMSKFNLTEGVFDSLHMFINPGALPLGTASEALLLSQKTHKRDLPSQNDEEPDYENILDKVLKFMGIQDYSEDKKKFPLIFAECGAKKEEITRARATIEKIVFEGGEAENKLRVLPIECLFYKLHKKCTNRRNQETGSNDKAFSSIIMAKDMLDRDKFMYANIGCDFHSEKDINEKCCLSKVKRFGYSFVTYCLSPKDDNLVAGYHFPIEAKAEVISNEAKFLEDKEWEDEVAESFKNIRINSGTSLSGRSSFSIPSTRSAASFASSFSRGSKTESVPSLVSNPSISSGLSISEMMRNRRGGMRGSSRGSKRF